MKKSVIVIAKLFRYSLCIIIINCIPCNDWKDVFILIVCGTIVVLDLII